MPPTISIRNQAGEKVLLDSLPPEQQQRIREKFAKILENAIRQQIEIMRFREEERGESV